MLLFSMVILPSMSSLLLSVTAGKDEANAALVGIISVDSEIEELVDRKSAAGGE